jgi:uncharacterized membrane protein
MGVKDFLGGVWLGHPLHPGLVHLPTGLYPAALLCDILSHTALGRPEAWAVAAFWAIAVGSAAAILAAPAGLADWWGIKADKPSHRLGLWHMGLNVLVLGLFIANFFGRLAEGPAAGAASAGPLALSAIGVALLGVAGYLGGRMVYAHGTSVVRLAQAKEQWRRLAEAGHANLPPEK